MHATGRRPCLRTIGSDPLAARGAALPALPTLATALVLGGLGLLCQHPAAPSEPPRPVTVRTALPRMIEITPAGGATTTPWVGYAAFERQYPLSIPAADGGRPSRGAATPSRRCPSGTCETARVAAQSRPAPSAPERSRDHDVPLPVGALPSAPTAAAMVEDVAEICARAVGLGGSVATTLLDLY